METRDFSPMRIHQPVFVHTVCFVDPFFSIGLAWQWREK